MHTAAIDLNPRPGFGALEKARARAAAADSSSIDTDLDTA
jgi:hypothetical protein